MRPVHRLRSFLFYGVCTTLAWSAILPACSDSEPSDSTTAAGSSGRDAGTGGARGGAGGAGGSVEDASGAAGAGGMRDATAETNDAGSGGRDADGSGDGADVRRDAGAAGGGIDDASDGRGGASGTGGAAGATDGASGDIADAGAEADATIGDASDERADGSVDGSRDQGTDPSVDRDGGSSATDVVAAGVRWFGRVDTTNAGAPRFSWSGTGFAARFSGTSVGIDLQNEDVPFFQVVIDGQKANRFQATKGRSTYVVANGLAAGSHTLELYRESETYYGASQFFGLTRATMQTPPPSHGRLIEFVGDSISAGYGNLGSESHGGGQQMAPCGFTLETESAYLSYASVAARALGAEASIVAESGWGVYRDRTGSTDGIMPKVYDRILGNDPTPVWDFRTTPQAVVINLGTNDFALDDPGQPYATALAAFIDTIRSRYPRAWIFCAVGTMYTNVEHAQALAYTQTAVNSRGGEAAKVGVVDFRPQDETKGTGCDWHPNVAEHQRMADVLVPVLKAKLGW